MELDKQAKNGENGNKKFKDPNPTTGEVEGYEKKRINFPMIPHMKSVQINQKVEISKI